MFGFAQFVLCLQVALNLLHTVESRSAPCIKQFGVEGFDGFKGGQKGEEDFKETSAPNCPSPGPAGQWQVQLLGRVVGPQGVPNARARLSTEQILFQPGFEVV